MSKLAVVISLIVLVTVFIVIVYVQLCTDSGMVIDEVHNISHLLDPDSVDNSIEPFNASDTKIKCCVYEKGNSKLTLNCTTEFAGFCLNGGLCFHLVDENITACQ